MKYAVIETGGKQYRVTEGEEIITEILPGVERGQTVTFDRVLLVRGGEDPTSVRVGTPYLTGAQVQAEVSDRFLGEKITVYTYKRKTRYHRKMGHRQPYLKARIKEIRA